MASKRDMRPVPAGYGDSIGEWLSAPASALAAMHPYELALESGDVIPAPHEDAFGNRLPTGAPNALYFVALAGEVTVAGIRPGAFAGQSIRLSLRSGVLVIPAASGSVLLDHIVIPGLDVVLAWDPDAQVWATLSSEPMIYDEDNPLYTTFPRRQLTPFGDVRTANPYTLADIVNKYGVDPLVWDTRVAGGGAVDDVLVESSIRLSSDGALATTAGIRTNTFFRYQAGKANRTIVTCAHDDAGQTGQVREWGLFDDDNGVFYRLNGTELELVIRSSASGSVVDTVVPRASWVNEYADLDVTKGNIYEVAFQWLGVGVVQFFINGVLVHQQDNPNTLPRVYMRTAVLPVSAEVRQTADGAAGSMRFICASVRAEGGSDAPEEQFGYAMPVSATVGTTLIPLFSIRVKDLFNTVDNRMQVFPRLLSIESDQRAITQLILNPTTLTGATFAVDPSADSGVEVDTAATAVAGGRVLGSFFSGASVGAVIPLDSVFRPTSPAVRKRGYGGSRDVITVAMRRAGNQDADAIASLAWGEVR